jgi:hypothetical protein
MSTQYKVDNRGVLSRHSLKSEDGYFNGTTGLPVGTHWRAGNKHHLGPYS